MGIFVCIIVIDKEGVGEWEGIFMMDVSKGYKKDGNKNCLCEQDIYQIVDVFNNVWVVDKYFCFVLFMEIEKNEYNFNILCYIDMQEEEDIQDLNVYLNGGILEWDIVVLNEFWQVYF